jgi:hypothetical protein
MNALQKSKLHQGDYDRAKSDGGTRKKRLTTRSKITFQHPIPVSIEQPTPPPPTKRDVRFPPSGHRPNTAWLR